MVSATELYVALRLVNRSPAPFFAAAVDWTADSLSEGDADAACSSSSERDSAELGDEAIRLLRDMNGDACEAA